MLLGWVSYLLYLQTGIINFLPFFHLFIWTSFSFVPLNLNSSLFFKSHRAFLQTTWNLLHASVIHFTFRKVDGSGVGLRLLFRASHRRELSREWKLHWLYPPSLMGSGSSPQSLWNGRWLILRLKALAGSWLPSSFICTPGFGTAVV